MSATHTRSSSTWQSSHSFTRPERAAKAPATQAAEPTTGNSPPRWLVSLGQLAFTVLTTLLMLPLMALGIFVALIVSAWMFLVPALVAGLVIVLVSLVLG